MSEQQYAQLTALGPQKTSLLAADVFPGRWVEICLELSPKRLYQEGQISWLTYQYNLSIDPESSKAWFVFKREGAKSSLVALDRYRAQVVTSTDLLYVSPEVQASLPAVACASGVSAKLSAITVANRRIIYLGN